MPAKREPAKRKPKTKKVSLLLGVGLDGDGERRITKGRDFLLVGGSPDTHELMTETMVKTFEELKRRDKKLETVDPRELGEIIHKAQPR